jgi:hypothetical protein
VPATPEEIQAAKGKCQSDYEAELDGLSDQYKKDLNGCKRDAAVHGFFGTVIWIASWGAGPIGAAVTGPAVVGGIGYDYQECKRDALDAYSKGEEGAKSTLDECLGDADSLTSTVGVWVLTGSSVTLVCPTVW